MKIYFFIPLAFVLLLTQPVRPYAQQKPDSINVKALIDSLNSNLNRNYIFPDKAKAISAYLESQYKKRKYQTADPSKLTDLLSKDISYIHHDPHMWLNYEPQFEKALREKRKPSEEELKRQVRYLRDDNYHFKKVELLPGNIGYIQFNGFTDDIEGARSTVSSAFKFLENSKAVVIDLRYNGGGSPEMVSHLESYFFKEKIHMMDIVSRIGNDTTSFYADPAETQGLSLLMPVYILTSKKTFSGAEDFSYGMQSVKRAVIIGEATGGGAHPTNTFPIGQGYVMDIPYARSLNPYTRTDWEGAGVQPDVRVAADKALTTAREIIFKERLLTTKDEKTRRSIQWQLNALKAGDETTLLSDEALAEFTGIYSGGLNFYVENKKLLCKNAERENAVFELKPITETVFLLDENAHVEFIKDNAGYSKIKLHFFSGHVVEKAKLR